jgi:hypothetical protein
MCKSLNSRQPDNLSGAGRPHPHQVNFAGMDAGMSPKNAKFSLPCPFHALDMIIYPSGGEKRPYKALWEHPCHQVQSNRRNQIHQAKFAGLIKTANETYLLLFQNIQHKRTGKTG